MMPALGRGLVVAVIASGTLAGPAVGAVPSVQGKNVLVASQGNPRGVGYRLYASHRVARREHLCVTLIERYDSPYDGRRRLLRHRLRTCRRLPFVAALSATSFDAQCSSGAAWLIGVVTPQVSSVRLHRAEDQVSDALLYPVPPGVGVAGGISIVRAPLAGQAATLVAEDADGATLASRSFAFPSSTVCSG